MLKFKWLFAAAVISAGAFGQSPELKPGAWVPLPAIGSSPETGFQYGAYVMRIFPQTDVGVAQNRVELLVQGTSQGQYQAYFWPNMYLQNGRWQLRGSIGGRYWPNQYYGQGNETPSTGETYADTSFETSLTVNYQLTPSVSLGSSVFFETHEIENLTTEPSLLFNNQLTGIGGGLYSGIGLNAHWDKRDNIDWPTTGHSISATLNNFTPLLGSDATFQTVNIRAANYYSLDRWILAAAAQFSAASNQTPFTHLPRPQGDRSLRGANGNRWLDQNALGLQLETRKTLTAKWAMVGFFDSFQVAPQLAAFNIADFHTSIGSGVRFGMTPDRFNIRFDLGWVDFKEVGFAVSVGEAF